MINWMNGYTASYYMTIVDPYTWRDLERVEIKGGSIKRTTDGLRESALIDCRDYPEGIEHWVRLWFDADQNGGTEHVPLFTGLATSPSKDVDGVYVSRQLEAYSVLKAVSDIGLLRGWYAPAGVSGGSIIKDLLSVLSAPVTVAENSPTLASNLIADNEETRLTMVDKILDAINWRLRIGGDGSIYVEPKTDESVMTLDPLENDIIETQLKVSYDLFSCPNVFMAIDNDLTAIARDDSADSPLSTVNRGREVWTRDTSAVLSDDETIEQYAERRLKEEQAAQQTASYDRRFHPSIYPGDNIRMHYPEQGLDGIYSVTTQSIELSYAARTSEEVKAT